MPVASATRPVVKRCAPSRARTRAAASRMSATSLLERTCRGCFLKEIRDFLPLTMYAPVTRIVNATLYSYSRSPAHSCDPSGQRNFMTTLTTSPCAAVVARLFAEADASDARLHERRRALPAHEQATLMASNDDYQALY